MSRENLSKEEAKEKLKNLVDDIKIAMMVTGPAINDFSAVPMTTKKVDNEGNIWFLSGRSSEHNKRILEDHRVQLLYSDPSGMEFISVSGKANISEDREIIKDLFDKPMQAWFDGPEDPELTAIKFSPEEAHFWDSQENKYKTLYKLGIAALTGDKKDIGESGQLKF